VKYAVRLVCFPHEHIESLACAREDVRHVADIQANALGLARRAGRVDDGREIGVLSRVWTFERWRIRCRFLQNFVKKHKPSRVRPLRRQRLRDRLAERRIACKQKPRQAILHHRCQFARRLARVKRHNNHAFGKQGEIERYPAGRVWRKKRATFAGLKSRAPQMRAHSLHLLEQFLSRNADELLAMNFAKHYAAIGPLQLRENVLEKIRHGGCDRHHRDAVPATECCGAAAEVS
jgi:hypothetical protein